MKGAILILLLSVLITSVAGTRQAVDHKIAAISASEAPKQSTKHRSTADIPASEAPKHNTENRNTADTPAPHEQLLGVQRELVEQQVSWLTRPQRHRLLMVSMAGIRSHSHFYGQLARVLADRGHMITLITGFELPQHPNIHQIVVDGDIMKIQESTLDLADKSKLLSLLDLYREQCLKNLEHPEIQSLDLKKFDLVLYGALCSDCFLTLLDGVEVPMISYFPNTITSVLHDIMGSIEFPSVTPDAWYSYSYPMSYRDRAGNLLAGYASLALNKLYIYPQLQQRVCEEGRWCPGEGRAPSLYDVNKQAALLFINTVEALQRPARPLPPNVIPIGGLNCRAPQPLPEGLKEWVDKSTDGFIYFSLGSAVKLSDINETTVRSMMESFRRMGKNVLWKSNLAAPDYTPPNVRMESWLPQQDILGHPNCLLFISHGGLFSVTEATYHGVPLLFMPAYGDQAGNAARVEREGRGLTLDLHTVTEDLLTAAVGRLLGEDSFKDVAKQQAALMRDQPLSPQALAVYWTEYVIRHAGAPHLASPFRHLHWFQIYNLDIWLPALGAALTLTAALLTLLRFIVRKCVSCFSRPKIKQH